MSLEPNIIIVVGLNDGGVGRGGTGGGGGGGCTFGGSGGGRIGITGIHRARFGTIFDRVHR